MNFQVKQFLTQESPSEGLFSYSKNGYVYLKGAQRGMLVSDLMKDYYYEQLNALEEIYDEGNYNTKLVINDILRIHYKKSKI